MKDFFYKADIVKWKKSENGSSIQYMGWFFTQLKRVWAKAIQKITRFRI